MIKVLRVDDRLLHGQVAVLWANYYRIDTIVIADNEVVTDEAMQIAFKLATPPGLRLSMKSLDGAAAVINNPKHEARTIMVITRFMKAAEYLCNKTGSAIHDVLLGGLRNGKGKKRIDMNSYMDAQDLAVTERLEKQGRHVFMQADPGSRVLLGCDIRKNFYK